jgi:hypothetical protein
LLGSLNNKPQMKTSKQLWMVQQDKNKESFTSSARRLPPKSMPANVWRKAFTELAATRQPPTSTGVRKFADQKARHQALLHNSIRIRRSQRHHEQYNGFK